MPAKDLIVVAGPNGAGKSTFVASFLSKRPCPYFCADLIAKEFAHLDPMLQQIAAGREFLQRVEQQLAKEEDFVVETTLSGKTLRKFLERARAAGFSVTIVFIYLFSADACVVRVRQRVESGGHNVPEGDIRRRFGRSFANFWQSYRQIADYWYVVYNSSGKFELVASLEEGAISIHDDLRFRQFLALAGVSDAEIDD